MTQQLHHHDIRRLAALLALAAAAALGACDKTNPAEVRSQPEQFPLRAKWNASASPAGASTVSGTLAVSQYAGFQLDANMTLHGTPGATYQWRIYRGDCATTTAAPNATTPTGLWIFATTQSYPDIKADASGAGIVSPEIAGSLDSLTAYSVRVRVAQTSTAWDGTKPVACGDLKWSPAS